MISSAGARSRARCIVKAEDDKDRSKSEYKQELKKLVKTLQGRKIEQMQEIQSVQNKILEDFKQFHVAALKIYQKDLQKKIDNIESKEEINESDSSKIEVIDSIDIKE
jgi:hypothetical protein